MSTAVLPLEVWEEGITQPRFAANDNALRVEAIERGALTFAPSAPGSPADGNVHIVSTAWGGFSVGDIVLYRGGQWYGFAPVMGLRKYMDADSKLYVYDGGWGEVPGGGGGAARDAVTALSIASGSVAVDVAAGDFFTLALSANVTGITFSGLPGSGKGASIMFQITQDSTPRTVVWPSSFRWAGGSEGTVSASAGAVDLLALTTFDNGTTWQATLSKGRA